MPDPNMTANVRSASELARRLTRLRSELDRLDPDWRTALVFGKIHLLYLAGTMQNGVLVIPRDGDAVFFVRRSYSRALDESAFPDIRPMRSFRDVAEQLDLSPESVHVEKGILTLSHFELVSRYLSFADVRDLGPALARTRAIKSDAELACMRAGGAIHRHALESFVPACLREGLSEADLGIELQGEMLRLGHHGVTRIAMFDTELYLGQICFGDSSVYPNPFDGPGGVRGLGPSAPLFGSRNQALGPDQLVFVDVGCGVDGYHTDKTMVYAYGDLPSAARDEHRRCVDIYRQVADRLRPGEIPSEIYEDIVGSLPDEWLEGFMGSGSEQVRFLGHGVGLVIDEYPVIAKRFDEPLQAGMTLAVEPKKAVSGVGMVGLENTLLVTPDGGVSMTGKAYAEPLRVEP